MKVIAFITDYSVVDRIINHLKLTFVAHKPHVKWNGFLDTIYFRGFLSLPRMRIEIRDIESN